MSFLKDVSITGAGGDIWSYIRSQREHSLLIWVVACIPTSLILFLFYLDAMNASKPLPRPVIYFESWPLDRSLADIRKDQAIREEKRQKILEERKASYRALGRAAGMDVEKIEAEAAEAQRLKDIEEAKKKTKEDAAAKKIEAGIKSEQAPTGDSNSEKGS